MRRLSNSLRMDFSQDYWVSWSRQNAPSPCKSWGTSISESMANSNNENLGAGFPILERMQDVPPTHEELMQRLEGDCTSHRWRRTSANGKDAICVVGDQGIWWPSASPKAKRMLAGTWPRRLARLGVRISNPNDKSGSATPGYASQAPGGVSYFLISERVHICTYKSGWLGSLGTSWQVECSVIPWRPMEMHHFTTMSALPLLDRVFSKM